MFRDILEYPEALPLNLMQNISYGSVPFFKLNFLNIADVLIKNIYLPYTANQRNLQQGQVIHLSYNLYEPT